MAKVTVRNRCRNYGFMSGYLEQYYCPKCKTQLGWIAEEKRIEKCPLCKTELDWSDVKR